MVQARATNWTIILKVVGTAMVFGGMATCASGREAGLAGFVITMLGFLVFAGGRMIQ